MVDRSPTAHDPLDDRHPVTTDAVPDVIPPPLGIRAVGDIEMAYVYLLYSFKTHQLYLGWTTDLRRRLCQHNAGESRATRGRGPYELIYYEAYRHKAEAMAREQSLKKYSNVLKQLKRRLAKTLTMASARFQEVGGLSSRD